MKARNDAAEFDEAERRLNEWGAACRRNSERLGQPTMSSMAQTLEHVRAEERRLKGVRKKAIRAKLAAGEVVDPKEVAVLKGFIEPETTANGKQKVTFWERRLDLGSEVMQIDKIVRELPNWMQPPIFRTYLYSPQQPFRIAAGELRMDLTLYRSRWRAAVSQVAEKLAERKVCAVK